MRLGRGMATVAYPRWPQLLLCILLAPVLSAILYGTLALLVDQPDGVVMLSPFVWLIVLFYGLLPTLFFGSLGCILAEYFLETSHLAAWSVAGAGSALTYVAMTGLVVMGLGLERARMFAPWWGAEDGHDVLGMGLWAVPVCIVLAGAIVGTLYRWLTRSHKTRLSAEG